MRDLRHQAVSTLMDNMPTPWLLDSDPRVLIWRDLISSMAAVDHSHDGREADMIEHGRTLFVEVWSCDGVVQIKMVDGIWVLRVRTPAGRRDGLSIVGKQKWADVFRV